MACFGLWLTRAVKGSERAPADLSIGAGYGANATYLSQDLMNMVFS